MEIPPQVSVIMPAYNAEKHVRQAIDSVLNQTYKDWELVVVNDGSTDNTFREIAQVIDPRIHEISQPNRGVSAARNTGIKLARGTYLAFLDADDYWLPPFLEYCTEFLNKDGGLAGVYTRYQQVDAEGNRLFLSESRIVHRALFRNQLVEGGYFAPHTAVIRADMVRQVGLFDESLSALADWDFWMRISRVGEMEGLPRALARYRVSPNSMSSSAERMHSDRIAILKKHFGKIGQQFGGEPEEKRRAYGLAYRLSAVEYMQQNEMRQAARLWKAAVAVWPPILTRLDTFYEWVCRDQQREHRGDAGLLKIAENATKMFVELNCLFEEFPRLRPFRNEAYCNAYLALGMLSDEAGNWSLARQDFLRAFMVNPASLWTAPVRRRFLRLCLGQRLCEVLRLALGKRRADYA